MGERQLYVRDLPREIKQALMAAAEAEGSNFQAMAVGILAREFKVPYTPGRARANPVDEDKLNMNLRMPPELHKRIRVRAAEQGIAQADLALLILGRELGIEIEPDRLNRRKGRNAA